MTTFDDTPKLLRAMAVSVRHKEDKTDVILLAAAKEIEAARAKELSNATFLSFRSSGKWYTTGRGFLPENAFNCFEKNERRERIIEANNGKYPGLSGPGNDFILIIIGDESIDYGFPLMLFP